MKNTLHVYLTYYQRVKLVGTTNELLSENDQQLN